MRPHHRCAFDRQRGNTVFSKNPIAYLNILARTKVCTVGNTAPWMLAALVFDVSHSKYASKTDKTTNQIEKTRNCELMKMPTMCPAYVVILCVLELVAGQRVAPGVPPQHYQQVPQQQYQHQVPVQHVNLNQQVPGQHQVPLQPVHHNQVPMQQPHHQQQQPHHQQPPHQHHGQAQVLNTANIAHEKEHIAEHLEVPIDTSKMSEQELQFHYFKMHDADNNNKLDGCELIKSLIHWHEQGSKDKSGQVEDKIFKDEELMNLIDPILNVDDNNRDGYIDYPEFVRAQQKAAAQPRPSQ